MEYQLFHETGKYNGKLSHCWEISNNRRTFSKEDQAAVDRLFEVYDRKAKALVAPTLVELLKLSSANLDIYLKIHELDRKYNS